ncbi:MAG: hydroxymethylglutaryl-CoA reductase, degradative [Flexilinea sp.]
MSETKKYYQLTPTERLELLMTQGLIDEPEADVLSGKTGLTGDAADHMIENVVGLYSLPVGIAQNFIINGRPVQVPMVIEEPSVVAAASNGAKVVSLNGGFTADSDEPRMIGQLQLVSIPDMVTAENNIRLHKDEILKTVAGIDPVLAELGGGPVDLQVRSFPETPAGPMLILHLIMDVRDAMGANAINTALEKISPRIEELTGGEVRLRILTNLADQRLARARCRIHPDGLAMKGYTGEEVLDRILEAAAFAEVDPYRAVTHNKGIMNGIDAVALATGNDWRAIEAGAHAWAARSGKISPLSHWTKDIDGTLCGEIELPLAVGTIGGATRVHPGARAALKLMKVTSSKELAQIMAGVGLAQNLAALRALSTEGIQKGHMMLHARQVAMAAGASGQQIDSVAAQIIKDGIIRIDHAKEILNTI